MLQLKQGETVLQTLTEGAAFTLPNGDTVSPAYAGWASGEYSLAEATLPPEPTPEEILAAARDAMSLTFVQLLIGLVSEGWITQADGEAWLTGTLPAPVVALIQTLPQGQQFAATARATRPSVVLRTDPLLNMLADTQGKTPEQVDQFFRTYEVA